ncbi:MAG: sodium:calcium antiporter, partial [Acutalibacteraceae bacterium]
LIVATAILYAASFGEKFSPVGSLLLLIIFAVSLYESVMSAKSEAAVSEKRAFSKKEIPVNILKFIAGAAGIVIGADFLVDSATEIAAASGVSEAVISATIVAVGTSLPELVTTVSAVIKKQSSLSVGNIIGANLIDIAIILPICSLVSGGGLVACQQNLYLDIPVCLGLLAAALIPMLIRGKFTRAQGIVMLVCYLAYVVLISFFNPF